MNSDLASSILTFFPVKRKKKRFSHVQEPVKLSHLKTTMRAIRSLQVTPLAKKSDAKLDTGYLIRVPDVLWEIRQVWWGRMWWENEFRRRNGMVAFVT